MKNINCNKIVVFMWLLFNLFIYLLDLIEPSSSSPILPWRRHPMETFSALLAICAGNSPVTAEFLAQRPVTRRFDVFFDFRPNKRLSKQWWGWWFETPPHPLWRHYNAIRCIQITSVYQHIMDHDCAGQFVFLQVTFVGSYTFRFCMYASLVHFKISTIKDLTAVIITALAITVEPQAVQLGYYRTAVLRLERGIGFQRRPAPKPDVKI